MLTFEEFPKIARLSRDCVITEKIDGTNAQIEIVNASDMTSEREPFVISWIPSMDAYIFAGSRTRYITPAADNFGFAAWVNFNWTDLMQLGLGRHYGEWWGSGIQRGYGLQGEKRFSLFNVRRWADDRDREKFPQDRPACCDVVPVLYSGEFSTDAVREALQMLRINGSLAAPGFLTPEGVIVFHSAASVMFKKTLEKDTEGKEQKVRRLAHTC